MLSVFVPAYDGPTNDNARLAKLVFRNSPRNLVIGSKATKKSLLERIQLDETTALLLMAHGSHEFVFAQDDEVALSIADILQDAGGVRRLKIFAWACKTSLKLGPAFHSAATSTGVWWGYRTTISAPSPKGGKAFQETLRYIAEGFHKVRGLGAARQFLNGLRDLCQKHRADSISSMAESRNYRDAYEIAVALNEMWMHLDALLPEETQPLRAEMFAESTLLEGV